jgi:hypothetical protein
MQQGRRLKPLIRAEVWGYILVLPPLDWLAHFRQRIFERAMPDAAAWGTVALVVGAIGLGLAMVFLLAYLRDWFFIRQSENKLRSTLPPRFGPLDLSLGPFLRNPLVQSVVSPDAAAEFVAERLETQHDFFQSLVRFFAYAPLLFGLMGTIFALRGLLVDTGTATLQQIQPALSGVFAGTLAGIMGSLMAAFGGVCLDATARRVNNRAQDFVHARILPSIPERRIAVQIEDAILERIGEKAEGVARVLERALIPLAARLTESAERSAQAAQQATAAFTAAERVLRDAGDIEKATRNFKAGAHMLDSSAESLTDATRQTAETLIRFQALHADIATSAEGLERSSSALGNVSMELAVKVADQVAESNRVVASLVARVESLAAAFASLSLHLVARANEDSKHVDAMREHSEATAKALAMVTEASRQAATMISSLPNEIARNSAETAEAIRKAVGEGLEGVAKRLSEVLLSVKPVLASSAQSLADAADNFRNEATTAREELTRVLRVSADLKDDLGKAIVPPSPASSGAASGGGARDGSFLTHPPSIDRPDRDEGSHGRSRSEQRDGKPSLLSRLFGGGGR